MRRERIVSLEGPASGDIKRAIVHMRFSLESPTTMADLVAHCGVPARTLNDHFRRFLGVSPIRYLRQLRLVEIRKILRSGAPIVSITDLARRFQFNHAGRFSRDYREQFGELPSVTLRRGCAARNTVSPGAGNAGRQFGGPASREGSHPSIAILFGASAAGEPAIGRMAEWLRESIAAGLASIRTFDVTVPAYIHPSSDPRSLARKCGARYFLTGGIFRDEMRLRVTLNVVDAESGRSIWGGSHDGEFDRILTLQDRIIHGLRLHLPSAVLRSETERVFRLNLDDLDAYGMAIRALPMLYASTSDSTLRALDILGGVLEANPDDDLTAALAAWGHSQLVMYNETADPAAERDRSVRLLSRASVLDRDNPVALTARGAVHMMLGELEASADLLKRALVLDPMSGWTWARSGWLHSYLGNSRKSIIHFRRALELCPPSSRGNMSAGIGSAFFNEGRYASAVTWIKQAMNTQPSLTWPNRSLAVSYLRLGERQQARKSLDTLRRTHADVTVARVVAAVPFRPHFLQRLGDGLTSLGLPP